MDRSWSRFFSEALEFASFFGASIWTSEGVLGLGLLRVELYLEPQHSQVTSQLKKLNSCCNMPGFSDFILLCIWTKGNRGRVRRFLYISFDYYIKVLKFFVAYLD